MLEVEGNLPNITLFLKGRMALKLSPVVAIRFCSEVISRSKLPVSMDACLSATRALHPQLVQAVRIKKIVRGFAYNVFSCSCNKVYSGVSEFESNTAVIDLLSLSATIAGRNKKMQHLFCFLFPIRGGKRKLKGANKIISPSNFSLFHRWYTNLQVKVRTLTQRLRQALKICLLNQHVTDTISSKEGS